MEVPCHVVNLSFNEFKSCCSYLEVSIHGYPITEWLISGKIHQWMRSGGTTMTNEIPRISQLFFRLGCFHLKVMAGFVPTSRYGNVVRPVERTTGAAPWRRSKNPRISRIRLQKSASSPCILRHQTSDLPCFVLNLS